MRRSEISLSLEVSVLHRCWFHFGRTHHDRQLCYFSYCVTWQAPFRWLHGVAKGRRASPRVRQKTSHWQVWSDNIDQPRGLILRGPLGCVANSTLLHGCSVLAPPWIQTSSASNTRSEGLLLQSHVEVASCQFMCVRVQTRVTEGWLRVNEGQKLNPLLV